MDSRDTRPPSGTTLEALYEAILEAVDDGVYGLDGDGRVTFANPATETLTGWPRSEQIGRPHHDLVHHTRPDGQPYPAADCPIQATLRDGETRRGEEVFWRRDGTGLPVSFTSAPLRDADGNLQGSVVTFVDLTLQRAERRYRALVGAASNFVWRADRAGDLVEIDAEWLALTGLSRPEALGRGWLSAFHPEDRQTYNRKRSRAIARGRSYEFEYRLRCADGNFRWFVNRTVPVRDDAGHIVEWIGAAREITARKARESRLEQQATRDQLTGQLNRWQFEDLLENEINQALRRGSRFALVIFDVDHFKGINDRYGHGTGDAVLRQLTQIAGANIRNRDFMARWGGEEFVILLPGADAEGARRVAEAVRGRVEASEFPGPGDVTISAGVAGYQPTESWERLMERADAALYAAKRGGRNRVSAAAETGAGG